MHVKDKKKVKIIVYQEDTYYTLTWTKANFSRKVT